VGRSLPASRWRKRVLVIEAGDDPAKITYPPQGGLTPFEGEVTVSGYYAAASEDKEMSWMFSVRHHDNDATQGRMRNITNTSTQTARTDPKQVSRHAGQWRAGSKASFTLGARA